MYDKRRGEHCEDVYSYSTVHKTSKITRGLRKLMPCTLVQEQLHKHTALFWHEFIIMYYCKHVVFGV